MTEFIKLQKINKRKTKKGSALVLALVGVVIVSTILSSLLIYVTSQINYSKDKENREKAFQIAEAGITYYRWYLAHKIEGKTPEQVEEFWTSGNPAGVGSNYVGIFKNPEGEPLGEYELEVDAPQPGSTILSVKSTGFSYDQPSAKRIIKVRFRRPSWSENVFLSNSFMNFGNQSVVYGKVHSNEGIRFDGKAYNTVSSHKATFDDPTYGGNRQEFAVHTTVNPADNAAPSYPWNADAVPIRSDIFIGGREFPVTEINFAGVTSDLANMRTMAQNGKGKYFDGTGLGRRITLKSNGTYDVCTVNVANNQSHDITRYWKNDMSGWCNSCTGACAPKNYPIIDGGVIFVDKSVWVEGTINNQKVTIAAGGNSSDVYIGISNNNLTMTAFNCDNMLGLIAQRDVIVLNDCPTNFIVDAALLAQTGQVGIVGGMGGKQSLTFNGAIASYLQPFFQNGNSGFADRTYNFNNNLLYCPPPYFPTGSEYSIDQWDEL